MRLRRRGPVELSLPVPWALLDEPAPLEPGGPDDGPLRVALIIPPFRRGSGGHATIANLVRGLEARGHACSLWVADDEGRHAPETPQETAASFAEFFGPVAGSVHKDLAGWDGADVAVATGWQTVPEVLRLRGVHARAYLVQDHEPEFYGTSAERTWAEATYRQGLHCIAASPWLADLLRERYGASASAFDLGVRHDLYAPEPVHRRDDLVLVYARAVTPRRAVPLALLAMAELHRRRPRVEIALFGESRPLHTPFPARDLGVLDPAGLSHAYNSATVGVCLSLTNPSLVPTEMMACGLACVDLRTGATSQTFGEDGPVTLVAAEPRALADAVERLLDDIELRAERVRGGLELAAGRTWDAAAEQVEAGLREALR